MIPGPTPEAPPTMAAQLPAPASTTEVYLAAIVDRLDKLLAAGTPAPTEPTPAPRRRAPKPTE